MNNLLNKRRAGVLLHITSLPGTGERGELGQEAYNFVNFLHDSGVSVWQTLPLGMPHGDGSPYQCLSAHAGNPALIDIDGLIKLGWLSLSEQCQECKGTPLFNKSCLVAKAFKGFLEHANQKDKDDFSDFCQKKAYWLDDFALFIALRIVFNQQCWNQWPEPFKERDMSALNEARRRLATSIEDIKFEQYVFFRQWMALKAYANERGVLLFGDIPIFVSYDSSDVWAHREVFKLDESGEMLVVAGVPPDYFSETGQRWGNPHYDWSYLNKTGFAWWIERMQTQLEQFDILRIDHFRGLEAAWEIPADEPTAQNGRWVKAPGKDLLNAIKTQLGSMPLVAEDLGIITDEVDALRDEFLLPGMKILQFAFGSGPDNPYLPDHYERNCVVYTGTHDNDTTIGWSQSISEYEKNYIYEYLGNPSMPLHCAVIQAALASVANLAVIPMQDILELGSEARMNTPGTTVGNWNWRFQWDQLSHDQTTRFTHLVALFNRK
ncbi:MAG: 4-alpha-glucanotransferase [Methylococcaceae bacterium]|nr:4-alpha-glucanotransferase [Methylococcaceae bacterium]